MGNASSNPDLPKSTWRNFTSNMGAPARLAVWGDQFGQSFSNNSVDSKLAYQIAVQEIRSISFTRGDPSFIDWLRIQPGINWLAVINNFQFTSNSPFIPHSQSVTLTNLQKRNYETLALWDIRCDRLPLTITDRDDPEYWMERWELFRLFYLGGRHMALLGTKNLELYNEPDHDACEGPDTWIDDYRIRSSALRDAFADHSTWKGLSDFKPFLLAPTTTGPFSPKLGQPTLDVLHKPFGFEEFATDDFYAADSYAFHRYGTFSSNPNCTTYSTNCKPAGGYGLESAFIRAKIGLQNSTVTLGPFGTDIWITEFNCFTNAIISNVSQMFFNYQHGMDKPSTAACVASLVLNLIDENSGPPVITFFKMVQALAPGRRTTKNGLYFASIYPPYDISGTTLAGEAFRMVLQKIPRDRHNTLYSFAKSPKVKDDRFFVLAVDDDKAYYIYSNNEEWVTHNITLDFSQLLPEDGIAGNLIDGVLTAGDSPPSIVVSGVGVFQDGTASYGEVVQYGPYSNFAPQKSNGSNSTDGNDDDDDGNGPPAPSPSRPAPRPSPIAAAPVVAAPAQSESRRLLSAVDRTSTSSARQEQPDEPSQPFFYSMPPGSLYMITIPKKPTKKAMLSPSQAVSVRPGDNGLTNYDGQPLVVASSPDTAEDTSVVLLQFDLNPRSVATQRNLVTAVFFIDLQSIGNADDVTTTQVLQVNALQYDQWKWKQPLATWNFVPFLKPLFDGGVFDTSRNFVNWQFPGVRLAGMLSVSPSDVVRQQQNAVGSGGDGAPSVIRTLAVDVTELLMDFDGPTAVTVFLSRSMRVDDTPAGPPDMLQGAFTFGNPRLVIEYLEEEKGSSS